LGRQPIFVTDRQYLASCQARKQQLYAKAGRNMRTRQIDPRDSRWEVDRPAYRIHFWRKQAGHIESGWSSDEWEIDDADIDAVLRWTDQQADGRVFTLYAIVTDHDGVGLIRLLGHDPTS
jgi:hypothetical protein